jgi:hypothetical protein
MSEFPVLIFLIEKLVAIEFIKRVLRLDDSG